MTDEKYSRIMNLRGYNTDLFIDMVAVKEGEFTCFAGIWIDKENNVAYVEPVGTEEQYRKKGLARATIYSALERASSLGSTRAIVLSYGEESKQMYEKLGFRPQKKEFIIKKHIS
jgi:GNAT superfamily N-acetyltransferase